jgi:hypothetical protein
MTDPRPKPVQVEEKIENEKNMVGLVNNLS